MLGLYWTEREKPRAVLVSLSDRGAVGIATAGNGPGVSVIGAVELFWTFEGIGATAVEPNAGTCGGGVAEG